MWYMYFLWIHRQSSVKLPPIKNTSSKYTLQIFHPFFMIHIITLAIVKIEQKSTYCNISVRSSIKKTSLIVSNLLIILLAIKHHSRHWNSSYHSWWGNGDYGVSIIHKNLCWLSFIQNFKQNFFKEVLFFFTKLNKKLFLLLGSLKRKVIVKTQKYSKHSISPFESRTCPGFQWQIFYKAPHGTDDHFN